LHGGRGVAVAVCEVFAVRTVLQQL
jgi:hypothetical protein